MCYTYNMEKDKIYANAKTEYKRWMERVEDMNHLGELVELSLSEDEQVDAFCKELKFGTSGMRGIIGMGTNRMNVYTVRRVTAGLADYLLGGGSGRQEGWKIASGDRVLQAEISVLIAFDSRKNSRLFALEVYNTLKDKGIKPYIFDYITPVSMLSYGIMKLGCDMGIMITASHNPKIFNGYKVYNRYGYQILGDDPKGITEAAQSLDYFGYNPKQHPCEFLDHNISYEYITDIADIGLLYDQPQEVKDQLSIVYTPLNGAGRKYVQRVLERSGFKNVYTVKSQEYPDENFTTCPAPNPENVTAYGEAFKTFEKVGADIIIATDPDSDRVGVAMVDGGMKVLLSGNQVGILMLDYMCMMRRPEKGQMIVKSIVSTPIAELIAKDNGLKVVNTLTGFKYIGQQIASLEDKGHADRYYFGFEESNGYLISPFVKDKDGVSGAMLICLMAAYHKSNGKNLLARLEEIYAEYGYCMDKTYDYYFPGPTGDETMAKIMAFFRESVKEDISGYKINSIVDYLGDTGLPKEDVIQLNFKKHCRLIIRPSGTEAKIRVYLYAIDKSRQGAGKFITDIEKEVKVIINRFKKE